MVRQRKTTALSVWMNGQRVGTSQRGDSRQVEFLYHATWLESEQGRPVSLSIPLGPRVYYTQKPRVASSKQGLSVPPVKPEKEHGAVARIQSWKGREQQESRQRLLSSHRAWVQQKWQASRVPHEQLRLWMLQQAQHVHSQLSKVQQQRAAQAQGSRP